MSAVLPLKPVEQPLGATAWLLLLCSPGVVGDFMRMKNMLRTNLLQTVEGKKKSTFKCFTLLNDRGINAEQLK